MKFYVVTHNSDNGVISEVYWDQTQAISCVDDIMRGDWLYATKEPYPGNWKTAYEILCNKHRYMDSYSITEHEVPNIGTKTIHIIASDGNDGTQAHAFNSREELDKFIWDEYVQLWDDEAGERIEDADQLADYYRACGGDWSIPMESGNWPDMLTIGVETHDIPAATDHTALLQSAKAEIDNLLDQIHQMKGMFSDEDNNIADAIKSAHEFQRSLTRATETGDAS